MKLMLCIVLSALIISGFPCGSSAKPLLPMSPQKLVIGNGADPTSLNPYSAQTEHEYVIYKNLFEGLLTTGENGQLKPALADSWELSEDARTYTFHLKKNLSWSNGDPLTAHDFVFALRYTIEPKNAQVRADVLKNLHFTNAVAILAGDKPAESLGVEAPDRHTLKISLDTPVPYALTVISRFIYPLHEPSVKQHSNKWAQPGNMVTNGPYTLKQWVINEYISLVKNPLYHDSDKVSINEVIFLPLEADAELKRYQADELHIATYLPAAMYEKLKKTIPEQVITRRMNATYFYVFNTTSRKFSNPTLRKALSLAIDRKRITDHITRQGEAPAYFATPPDAVEFTPPKLSDITQSRAEQIGEAQRLYKEAGFGSGKHLEVELLYNTRELHKQIALVISDMWKKHLGVKVTLKNQEFASLLADMDQGKFELARMSWFLTDPEPCLMLELFKTGHAFNQMRYSDPEYDRLQQQACTGIHKHSRAPLFDRLEQIIARDTPVIPIYFYVRTRLIKPFIGGFPATSDDYYVKDLYFKAP